MRIERHRIQGLTLLCVANACIGCGSANSVAPFETGGGGSEGTGGGSGGETIDSGRDIQDAAVDRPQTNDATADGPGAAVDTAPFAPLVWTKTVLPQFLGQSIGGTGETDVWLTGSTGDVYISAGDDVWTRRPTDTEADLYGLWGSGPDNVWVAVNSNFILRWTGKWTHEYQGIKAGHVFYGVGGASATDVYIAGGDILHSMGDGYWSPVILPANGGSNVVQALGPGEFVCADNEHTYHVTGTTATVELHGLHSTRKNGIWASSSTDIYVIHLDGIAHRRTDGKWIAEYTWASNANDGGQAIWGASATEVFAVTVWGTLLRSHGDGQWIPFEIDPDWKPSSVPLLQSTGIWGTSASNLYIGTTRGAYHGHGMN